MKSQQGFVLLDVVSGVLILCLGITFLLDLSQGARQAAAASRWKEQALNQAQAELEEIKAMGVDAAIKSGRVVPEGTVDKAGAENIELKVVSKWVNPDLLEINIDACWHYGSVQGQVDLSTLLSRR